MVKTTEFNVQTQMNYVVGNMSGFTAAYTGMNNLSALLSSIMTSYTTLAGTGRAAYMTLGASVAAFGLKSAEAFGEYQRGMNMVKAISNNTNAQMQMLAKSAGEFSGQFRMGIEDINSGLVTLGRAGLTDVNNQIEVLKNGLQVAKISGMDLASTLEDIVTTTSLLGGDIKSNTFGAETKEVSNLLVATSLSGPLNVSDVIETLKFAGGSAAAAGATLSNEEGLHDLLGTIGAFSQKGVTGSIAGTALRAFITKPASQDQKVSDALAKLGLDAYSLWEKDPEQGWHMKPIAEQIGMITKAMNDNHLTNLDRIEVWGDIVGNKMGQQMLKLDENRIKETTKDIEHQRNLEDIYQGTLTTFASQVERLNQIFQAIYRNIGSGFASSLTGIVEGVANILEFINNLGNGVLFKLIAPILGPLGLYGLAKGLTDFVHILQALRENIAISANTPLEDQDIWQTANGVVAKRYRQAWYDEEKRKNMEERSSGSFSSDEYYREKRERDEKQYRENQEYYAKRRARQEQDYNENQEYQRRRREQIEKDYIENKAYQDERRKQLEKDYIENQAYQSDRRNQIKLDYEQNQDYQTRRRALIDADYQDNQAYQKMRQARAEQDYNKSQQYYDEKRLRDEEFHQLRMMKLASLDTLTVGTQFAEVIAQHVTLNGNITGTGSGGDNITPLDPKFTKAAEVAIAGGTMAKEMRDSLSEIEVVSTLGTQTSRLAPILNTDGMLFDKTDIQYGIRLKDQKTTDALFKHDSGKFAIHLLESLEAMTKIGNFTGSLMNEKNIDKLITNNGILSPNSDYLHPAAKKYIDAISSSMNLPDEYSAELTKAFQKAYNSMITNYKKHGAYSEYFAKPTHIKAIEGKIEREGIGSLTSYQRDELDSYMPEIVSEAKDSRGFTYDPRHKLLTTLTKQAIHNMLGKEMSGTVKHALIQAIQDAGLEKPGEKGILPTHKELKNSNILDLLGYFMTTGEYENLTSTISHKNALSAKESGGSGAYNEAKTAIENSMKNRGFLDHLDLGSQRNNVAVMGTDLLREFDTSLIDEFDLSFNKMPIELDKELNRMTKVFEGRKRLIKPKVKDFGKMIWDTFLREELKINSPGRMATKLLEEVERFGQIFVDNIAGTSSKVAEMGQAIVQQFLKSIEPLTIGFESLFDGKLSTVLSTEFTRITTIITEYTIKIEELLFQMGSRGQAAYKRGFGIASPGYMFYASEGEFNLIKQLFTEASKDISLAAGNIGKEAVNKYRARAQELGLAAEQANHVLANINAGYDKWRKIDALQVVDAPSGQKVLTDSQLKKATATSYYQFDDLNRPLYPNDVKYEGRLKLPSNLIGIDFETTGTQFRGDDTDDRIRSWGLAKNGKIIPEEGHQFISDAGGLDSTFESQLVHKISEKGVSEQEAWDKLEETIGNNTQSLVAFNGKFEANVMRSAAMRGLISEDFVKSLKIYDAAPMDKDWIEKTNGFQILANLGTNALNSLGLILPDGTKRLANSLDAIKQFFGGKSETHVAGEDALDGVNIFKKLFSLQSGIGDTSILKGARQILWGPMKGKEGEELRYPENFTDRDKARKAGKYNQRGLSELEILALTTREDMGYFLQTNDDTKITDNLLRRAKQLNKDANLGFSDKVLEDVASGIALNLSNEQKETFTKLRNLQRLQIDSRRIIDRPDLYDYLTGDSNEETNNRIEKELKRINRSPYYTNINKSGKHLDIEHHIPNTPETAYSAPSYEDTEYGQRIPEYLNTIEEFVSDVKSGVRINTEDFSGTYEERLNKAYEKLNPIRSAVHSLSALTGYDKTDLLELLKPDAIPRGGAAFKKIFKGTVFGDNFGHMIQEIPDEVNKLEDEFDSLKTSTEKYLKTKTQENFGGKFSDDLHKILDGIFGRGQEQILTDSKKAAQFVQNQAEFSRSRTKVNKNPYQTEDPNKPQFSNPSFRSEEHYKEEYVSDNEYRFLPMKDLVGKLNEHAREVKVKTGMIFSMVGNTLKVSDAYYDLNTMTQEEYLNYFEQLENNFRENTDGLNAFWRSSNIKNPIRNFKTIAKIPEYKKALDVYAARFGTEYDIPEDLADFEMISNNINKNRNKLSKALAATGALSADETTEEGKKGILTTINRLLSNTVNLASGKKYKFIPGQDGESGKFEDLKTGNDVNPVSHADFQVAETYYDKLEEDQEEINKIKEAITNFKQRPDALEMLQPLYDKHEARSQKVFKQAGGDIAIANKIAEGRGYVTKYENDLRTIFDKIGIDIDDLAVNVGGKSVKLAESFAYLGKLSIKAFRDGLEMHSPPKAFTELITYLRETEDSASLSISKLHRLMGELRTELKSMPKGTTFGIGYSDKRLLEKKVYPNSPSLKNELKDHTTILSTQEEAHAKQQEAAKKHIESVIANHVSGVNDRAKNLITIQGEEQLKTIATLAQFEGAIKQANVTFKTGSEEWITQLMRTAGAKAEELMTEEEFVAALRNLMMQLRSGDITKNEFGTKASELVSGQENIRYNVDREKALDRKIDRMTQGGLTGKGWQVAYGLGGVGGKIGKGITGALSGAMSLMMNPVLMGAQMIWGYFQQAIEMWKQWEQEKIAKLSEIVSNAESAFDEQQSKWEEAKAKDDEDFSNLSDNEKQDKMLEAIAKAREDTNKNGYIDTDPETKALIGKQNELLRANNALMKEKSTQTLTGYDGIQANWEEFMNGSGMVGEANEYGLLDRLEGLVNPEKYRDDSNTRRLDALQTSLIQIDTRVKNMEEFTDDYQQVMASFGIANKSLLDIYNVRGIADLHDPNFLSGTFFDKSSNVGMGKGGMTAEQMALYMKKQEKILTRFENRFIRFVRKGDRITADLSNADIHTLAKQMGVSDLAAAQMTAVHLLQRIQDVMINQITPQLTEQAVAIYQGNYTLTATDQKESAQTALQKSLDAGIWAIQSQVAQLVYQSTMEQALSDYQAATGDTETNTVGLLLNRARDNSAEFHDIAKQYAAQGLGSFTETSKINEYINAHPGATQEEAINALAKGLTDKNGNGLFDELGEKFAQSEIEALDKHAYDSRADWISRNAGWIGGLAGGGIGATAGFFGGAAVGAVPGWAAGSALGTGAGIALGNLIGGAMGSTMQDTYEGWTDYTNAKMHDFALNVPIDNAVETLNDYMENAESEGDNGKDTDTSDADKQRYVQLAICNKKAIPKLNVNLFKKAPTFTVLNKNFKLRDIKINTADKAKNIENSLKNAIIDVQERSDPKIIQDSEGEYDPVGATDDATNLPTGASLTK